MVSYSGVVLEATEISRNMAFVDGAGVFVGDDSSTVLRRCTISGNRNAPGVFGCGVCEGKNGSFQIRRKWNVREKPVEQSTIGDYEWKLIPGVQGLTSAVKDASAFEGGRYYSLAAKRQARHSSSSTARTIAAY